LNKDRLPELVDTLRVLGLGLRLVKSEGLLCLSHLRLHDWLLEHGVLLLRKAHCLTLRESILLLPKLA
jgi:hypothetical protein